MNIVCFGEALIDFKDEGHLQFKGYEGGSPFNVAIAAARLGGQVGFASQLSSDMFGQALRRYLHDNGVDTSLIQESDAPTTLAFVSEHDGDAHFSFISNGAADTLYDPQPRPNLPASVSFVQFGSKSLLDEPTSSSITDIIAMHQDKAAVVLDPNCRPALIHDKAAYQASLVNWLKLSTIVKVSTQDLSWLYPDIALAAIAEDWLDYGIEAIIITDGGEGVSLYRQGQRVLQVAAPKISVVDTVGAGDTLTGSLMAELEARGLVSDFHRISDKDWREVLRFCTTAAAINCTRSGAQPPTRAEITTFLTG